MELIDSHCHLDDDRFDERRQDVIAQAAVVKVTRMVIPATTANRWEKVKQVCDGHDGLYPAYGLHPMFIEQHQVNHLRELDEWLEREQPIAVGECGIDFYDSRVDEKWQLQLFREQLQLANNHRLGVVHSFSGSQQQAQQLHDIGFKLGIAATLSFERAQKLRKIVAVMPDDALLIESDAPDQPGASHRGQLNEPAFIVEHLQTMAELRNCTVEELAATLNRNAESLFNI
jgi:TatD DNase family protein